ncbi:MAG: glutathione S-transferase family protein [Microcoleus sp. PH2017_01_SCD_O_A]|uniref:glutathione S-transferase family protein n=1 Tax=unclassified Microcoleus TaxID=2642155 RepID=UPI001DDCCC77|nr:MULTISPECIES: glutathione S-transferase family protein [unclassified Microcoleus]MCC3420544.1 glutathione S-transferase family protein [Microcoleus sp. PH2017_07_MST_O_A]MCC3431162.1 glutathione S-transferase family protein [Microcoleus sp. PH2017_04_SCI_O_A]MCC3506076.1 glutathione S-transferase family protein [Microcoleus sp. PH2017_19_SFW_U_A]MCC3512922.1 glutathione S-transferase family protein [Microcoleus sp. PH2017_17_BER_D_A]TAE53119.1 MAG: glutathione S-transferase family protein [
MFKLYEYSPSGNCYKVRLLLTQLNIPFDRTEINILQKESRTPEFLVKNPNGRIPVLEIVPGKFLFESNAIMFYLSEETEFFPSDKFERAQVMQWLFFEQYSHEPFIATSRFWYLTGKAEEYQAALQQKQAPGYAALGVMEQHLEKNEFFVGDRYSIADIGLFAYTHVAAEGGFDLTGFPAIQTWIERIKNQPRYISITD